MNIAARKSVSLRSAEGQKIINRVIEKSMDDRLFMAEFQADPKAALCRIALQMGLELLIPEACSVSVLEETATQLYIVLPADGDLGGDANHADF